MTRKNHFRNFLLFALFASIGAQAAPIKTTRTKAPKQYTIEQFMATVNIAGASFSADEKRVLFSSNASGIFNAYVLPVACGTPQALTQSTTDSTYAVSFFPNEPTAIDVLKALIKDDDEAVRLVAISALASTKPARIDML